MPTRAPAEAPGEHGLLVALSLSPQACVEVERTWRDLGREEAGFHALWVLGEADLVGLALTPRAAGAWAGCLGRLGLRPGAVGRGDDGRTALYSCGLAGPPGPGAAALDRPGCLVLAPAPAGQASAAVAETDGCWPWLGFVPGVGPDLGRVAAAGPGLVLPAVPLAMVVGDEELPAPLDPPVLLQVEATALPGRRGRAAALLEAALQQAAAEPGELAALRVHATHEPGGLVVVLPLRLHLVALLRRLWPLRAGPDAVLATARVRVLASGPPSEIGAGEEAAAGSTAASLFAAPSCAGGRDWHAAVGRAEAVGRQVLAAAGQAWRGRAGRAGPVLGEVVLRLRARPGSAAPAVALEDGAGGAVLEVALSSDWLGDPVRAAEAVAAAVAEAALRELLDAAGGGPGDLASTLGDAVGTALVLTLERRRRPGGWTLGQHAARCRDRHGSGAVPVLRLLGAELLLAAAEPDGTGTVPGLGWLDGIDGARQALLDELAGSDSGLEAAAHALLDGTPTYRLARAVLTARPEWAASPGLLGEGALAQPLLEGWTAAAELVSHLLFPGRLIPGRLIPGRRPAAAPQVDLPGWLRVEDEAFWRAVDLVRGPGAVRHRGALLAALEAYWDQLGRLEACTGQPVRWAAGVGLEGPSIEASLPAGTAFEDGLALADREARLRCWVAGGRVAPPVELRAGTQLQALRSVRDAGVESEAVGHELLATFDRCEPGDPDALVLPAGRLDEGVVPRFGDVLEGYVGRRAGDPLVSYSHTQLLRRMAVELRTLAGCAERVEGLATVPHGRASGPLSFNLTPGLLAPINPWARELSRELVARASGLVDGLASRRYQPVIELGDSDVLPELLWHAIEAVRVDSSAQLGVAFDDQFGPGADLVHLGSVVRRALRQGCTPLVIKVDHGVLRSVLAPAFRPENSRPRAGQSQRQRVVGFYEDAFTVMLEMIMLSCREEPPDYVVFEGLSGWSDDLESQWRAAFNALHREAMMRALDRASRNLERRTTVLAQGQD